jgi:hypothetical protein
MFRPNLNHIADGLVFSSQSFIGKMWFPIFKRSDKRALSREQKDQLRSRRNYRLAGAPARQVAEAASKLGVRKVQRDS